MRIGRIGGVLAAAALAGCAGMGVKVQRSGPAMPPRDPGCAVDFLRAPPDRPFDEVADLETHVTVVPPEGVEQVLRKPACALGADAVIITKRFVTNEFGHVLLTGTAIVYRAEGAAPPAKGLSL